MKLPKKQSLGRKPAKRRYGPKPPPGGRVRVSVNLPANLVPFVSGLLGRSNSDRIVQLIAQQEQLRTK